ncbi:hypothetical protein BGZ54_004934, partial [Gamsiella multidivaricata]
TRASPQANKDAQFSATPNPFLETSDEDGWRMTLKSLKHRSKTLSTTELNMMAHVYLTVAKLAPPEVQLWFRSLPGASDSYQLKDLTGVGENSCQAALRISKGEDIKGGVRTGRPMKEQGP